MGRINNLNNSQLPEVIQDIRTLGTSAPMNNAAIGRGGIEVYQNGTINVSDGNLIVNGTATISGVLNADGTVTLSGVVNISGPFTVSGNTDITGDLTVTGPAHINGPTDINGNLDVDGSMDINGPSTLNNDLTVQGGGQLNVGNTTISPSASNGGVEFVSGGGVGGNGGAVVVKGSGNAGLITGTTSALFAGTTQMTVSSGSVAIEGLPTVSGVTANLYMDPSSKQIKRIV